VGLLPFLEFGTIQADKSGFVRYSFERDRRYEEQGTINKTVIDSYDFSYCDSVPIYPLT
jgi:hypothetical protein